MAFPTPNGPTLADLEYAYYSNNSQFPSLISTYDATIVSENMSLNFVGYTNSYATEDFVNTSENVALFINPTGPNQFSITVSDTTQTSEFMQTLHNGAWDIKTSDTTVTSEAVTVTPPA